MNYLKNLIAKINTKGILLSDALIATAALTTASITMGFVISSSASNSILSRDYLIVEGLLNEGEAVVENLPATNQLRKPGKKNCWMMLDRNCNIFVEETNYIVEFKNGLFELEATGENELDLDGSSQQNSLPYQLYTENMMYVGSKEPKPENSKTRYFRGIKFTEVNNDFVTFQVKMQWKDGVKTREIKKLVTLYNYN